MPKHSDVYAKDILEAVQKIELYTKDVSYKGFEQNSIIADAVVRNLEIIGEAVKNISSDIKAKHPEIEWKKIAGLRDILIHEYSSISLPIVWDIITTKLSSLKTAAKKIESA